MKWRRLVAFLECLMVARPPGSSSISLDCTTSFFICSDDEGCEGFSCVFVSAFWDLTIAWMVAVRFCF